MLIPITFVAAVTAVVPDFQLASCFLLRGTLNLRRGRWGWKITMHIFHWYFFLHGKKKSYVHKLIKWQLFFLTHVSIFFYKVRFPILRLWYIVYYLCGFFDIILTWSWFTSCGVSNWLDKEFLQLFCGWNQSLKSKSSRSRGWSSITCWTRRYPIQDLSVFIVFCLIKW